MEAAILAIGILFGMIIGAIVGIFIGVERMRKSIRSQSIGYLRIDRSEPDEPPRPFLEITSGTIETISQKPIVMLRVVNENYISQK